MRTHDDPLDAIKIGLCCAALLSVTWWTSTVIVSCMTVWDNPVEHWQAIAAPLVTALVAACFGATGVLQQVLYVALVVLGFVFLGQQVWAAL